MGVDVPNVPATFDRDLNGLTTTDDLCEWERSPADLDGDGFAGEADRAYQTRAVRWGERTAMISGR